MNANMLIGKSYMLHCWNCWKQQCRQSEVFPPFSAAESLPRNYFEGRAFVTKLRRHQSSLSKDDQRLDPHFIDPFSGVFPHFLPCFFLLSGLKNIFLAMKNGPICIELSKLAPISSTLPSHCLRLQTHIFLHILKLWGGESLGKQEQYL